MLDAITTGVTTVIGYVGNIIKAITGTVAESDAVAGAWGALLPDPAHLRPADGAVYRGQRPVRLLGPRYVLR